MTARRSKAWFAPKRYGYGASLPIAWQGWAALVAFLAAIGTALVQLGGLLRSLGVGALIVLFSVVCFFKTEGGWRGRRGGKR